MAEHVVPLMDRAVRDDFSFLQDLLRDFQPRDFAFRFWDGTTRADWYL